TITTGEGGMAVTDDEALADRVRLMSLHGLSRDAWERYRGGGWDYRILAPGYKYNLTDLAAALGVHQVGRAEEMRRAREALARALLPVASREWMRGGSRPLFRGMRGEEGDWVGGGVRELCARFARKRGRLVGG